MDEPTDVRLSVLVVEDSPVEATLTHRMLSTRGTMWTVETVGRLSAALQYLGTHKVDIILLDLHLPDSRGLPTLNRVREAAPEIPIVVLTGSEDEQVGIDALKQGAQDYLLKKQWGSALLSRTLRYAVERFRAERALRQSEVRLRTIVDNAPLGITVVDPELKFVEFNPGLPRMLGYGDAELRALRLSGLLHAEEADFQFEIKAVMHDGTPRQRRRLRLLRNGGDVLWADVFAHRLSGEGPDPRHALVMIQDVTERERLLQEREQLLRQVADRQQV
jgi:PAS domain S-box-containing protein